jgi:hypothetical protein
MSSFTDRPTILQHGCIKFFETLNPCHFPVLNDGVEVAPQKMETSVPNAPSHPEILRFCEKQGIDVRHLIKAAWAVTLSHFIGASDVCFGASVLCAGDQGQCSREFSLCSIDIGNDLLVSELLQVIITSEVNGEASSQDLLNASESFLDPKFNTLISLVNGHDTNFGRDQQTFKGVSQFLLPFHPTCIRG